MRAKQTHDVAKSLMGCRMSCGEAGGAPVYLGYVAVLSEACDVFQGVGGLTDRAVMWGCLCEKLQIIRERREGVGFWPWRLDSLASACSGNNVQNYKEVLNIFQGPFFFLFLRLSLGKKEALFRVKVAAVHYGNQRAKPSASAPPVACM